MATDEALVRNGALREAILSLQLGTQTLPEGVAGELRARGFVRGSLLELTAEGIAWGDAEAARVMREAATSFLVANEA